MGQIIREKLRHEPIKKIYVEMVKRIVESEGANENDE